MGTSTFGVGQAESFSIQIAASSIALHREGQHQLRNFGVGELRKFIRLGRAGIQQLADVGAAELQRVGVPWHCQAPGAWWWRPGPGAHHAHHPGLPPEVALCGMVLPAEVQDVNAAALQFAGEVCVEPAGQGRPHCWEIHELWLFALPGICLEIVLAAVFLDGRSDHGKPVTCRVPAL